MDKTKRTGIIFKESLMMKLNKCPIGKANRDVILPEYEA